MLVHVSYSPLTQSDKGQRAIMKENGPTFIFYKFNPFVSFYSVSINSSNSNMFVSGSCDTTARLWDTRIASRAVRTYHGHQGDVNTVKFFPDGQRFGTGSNDSTCRLYDMRTGHQLQVYSQQHDGVDNDIPTVTSIAFSISGRLLFAGYSSGACYVWDTLLAEVYLPLVIRKKHNRLQD